LITRQICHPGLREGDPGPESEKDRIIYWTTTGDRLCRHGVRIINFTFIDRFPFSEELSSIWDCRTTSRRDDRRQGWESWRCWCRHPGQDQGVRLFRVRDHLGLGSIAHLPAGMRGSAPSCSSIDPADLPGPVIVFLLHFNKSGCLAGASGASRPAQVPLGQRQNRHDVRRLPRRLPEPGAPFCDRSLRQQSQQVPQPGARPRVQGEVSRASRVTSQRRPSKPLRQVSRQRRPDAVPGSRKPASSGAARPPPRWPPAAPVGPLLTSTRKGARSLRGELPIPPSPRTRPSPRTEKPAPPWTSGGHATADRPARRHASLAPSAVLMPGATRTGFGFDAHRCEVAGGNSSNLRGDASSDRAARGRRVRPQPRRHRPAPTTEGRSYCGRRPRRPRKGAPQLRDDLPVGCGALLSSIRRSLLDDGRKSIIARSERLAAHRGPPRALNLGHREPREIDQPGELANRSKRRVEIEPCAAPPMSSATSVPAQLTWMAGPSAPRARYNRRAWRESQPTGARRHPAA